jgi:hypothetical protein
MVVAKLEESGMVRDNECLNKRFLVPVWFLSKPFLADIVSITGP